MENILAGVIGRFTKAVVSTNHFEIAPAVDRAAEDWVLALVRTGPPAALPADSKVRRAVLARLRYAQAVTWLQARIGVPLAEDMIRPTLAGFVVALWDEEFHAMWNRLGIRDTRQEPDATVPGRAQAKAAMEANVRKGALRLNHQTPEWEAAVLRLAMQGTVGDPGGVGWRIAITAAAGRSVAAGGRQLSCLGPRISSWTNFVVLRGDVRVGEGPLPVGHLCARFPPCLLGRQNKIGAHFPLKPYISLIDSDKGRLA